MKSVISIESTLKSLTLLYIALVITGLVYNVYFYSEFAVSFTEYVDLDEVLMTFIPNAKPAYYLALPIGLVFFYFNKRQFEMQPAGSTFKRDILIMAAAFFLMFLFYFVFVDSFRTRSIAVPMAGTVFILLFYNLSLDFIFRLISNIIKSDVPDYLKVATHYYLPILFLTFFAAIVDVKRIKFKPNKRKFNIHLVSQEVISGDSATYYLGRTKKYLFIYNRIGGTRVLKVDDVREVVFYPFQP